MGKAEALRGDGGGALDGGARWAGLRRLARPAGRASADTVRTRTRSRALYLSEVIDGVVMDLEPRPFATFDDLATYCYRVASAVGLSCLHIWGYRSGRGRRRKGSSARGVRDRGSSSTNIVRDVREDALAWSV